MREIVTTLVNDPNYRPVLVALAVLLGIWLALSVTAALALCRAIMRRGRAWLTFSLALVPFIFGFIGVLVKIPFYWQGETVNVHYDLRWFFLLPLLLGGAALVFWWRGRQKTPDVAQKFGALEVMPESSSMLIAEAQREVRSVYDGGFFGQLVSGILWLTAAALGTWLSWRAAIFTLVLGGFLIFPAVMILLRLFGRPTSLHKRNPMRHLAMQVAFVLPLSMPLVAPVVMLRLHWFFPAMMVLLGAHYLPFTFLYGMRSFAALSALLVAAGLAIALWFSAAFSLGGWMTGLILLVFAFVGRAEASRIRAPDTSLEPTPTAH